MTTLGLTGTRSLGGRTGEVITRLESLRYDAYVTGACVGFDSLAGFFFATRYPKAEHTVIVPANRSHVATWWLAEEVAGRVDVIEMPEGSSYRDRNKEIVARADALWFCAQWPEINGHSVRSGTWQTIRLARAKGIPVDGVTLNPVGAT